MDSPNKDLSPLKVSRSTVTDKKRLRCINRCCNNGKDLTDAFELVCTYYNIDYKPGREVCKVCLTKCTEHYKHLEIKFKNEQCIMDAQFPSYDSHLIIGSSSDEEEEVEKKEPKPGTLNNVLFQDISKDFESVINYFFDKNKSLIEKQERLCENYLDQEEITIMNNTDDLDKFALELEDEISSFRDDLYEPFKPITTCSETVDINELEANLEKITTSNGAETIKVDKDIIPGDRTVCTVPDNLPSEGLLLYPPVEIGQTVYALTKSLKDPWSKSVINSIITEDYVHISFDAGEKLLTTKQIAYFTLNPVRFPVGCRVIAKFNDPTHTDAFYAGVVAEPPKILNQFRYLIFFDNGYFRYKHHQDIRLVARRLTIQVWNDVDQDFKEFIKSYLEKYPERQMVRLNNQHSVRAVHQNQWQIAKVLEVDASLVKLYFPDVKHSEWLYRGSSRLYNIFEKQKKSEKGIRLRQSGLAYLNKPFVEFTSVEEEPSSRSVARKSTNKGTITTLNDETPKHTTDSNIAYMVIDLKLPLSVPEPIKFTKHQCNHSCVEWTAYNYDKTRTISMLSIPLYFGFIRYLVLNGSQRNILYKTPCGKVLRNMNQMFGYLIATKSTMTIDLFDFNSWVKPFAQYKVLKCVSFLKDISEDKEFRGITCVNSFNSNLPPKMNYMTTRRAMPGVNINVESNFLCGCDCTDDCQDKSKCACWQMTIEGQKILPNLYKDPNIGYNYRRLPERVLTGIYECNKTCKCSSSCLNRVVQNPLSQNLQLFLTEKKGWGVRCLNDIPQGSFICIYVGYLLTETDANEGGCKYGDEYLADLDYIEVVEKIKEDYESDIPYSDNSTDKIQSESSEEQIPTPSTSDGKRSEMSLRLRKRVKHKKSKTKKDGKHVHVPSKLNACDMKNNPVPSKSIREYFGNNESVYIMDAKTSGNIGRYLNHSCSPNIFVQNVFVDTHDLRFPWVSFFAHHYIPAGTELTWDYSYDIGSVPGKVMKCHCESAYCRGRLL